MSPYCSNCGKEVEESWNICPNCGKKLKEQEILPVQPQQQPRIQQPNPYQQQPYQQQPYPPQPYTKPYSRAGNSYGTAALICGLLGLIFGILYAGIVLGIIAIIMGGIGISRDENPSMAAIGLFLGILDFVLFFIIVFFLFSWFSWVWQWWP